MIYDLKVKTYGEDKDLNACAREIIASSDGHFSLPDMLSDIDAKNISELYSTKDNLSYMIEDYYRNHYQNRYNDFVSWYGGIDQLEEVTDGFTRGNGIVKHMILSKSAKKAGNKDNLQQKYNESITGTLVIPMYDYYTGISYNRLELIHSLPDPCDVTPEESKALSYAFIEYIKENMES